MSHGHGKVSTYNTRKKLMRKKFPVQMPYADRRMNLTLRRPGMSAPMRTINANLPTEKHVRFEASQEL